MVEKHLNTRGEFPVTHRVKFVTQNTLPIDIKSRSTKMKDSSSELYQGGVFKDIYYYLYSNSNIPRAERLSAEFIRILFCKMHDELSKKEIIRKILALPDKEAENHFLELFQEVKKQYPDVFLKNENIHLDIKSIKYIFSQIANIEVLNSHRDLFAESFQTFIGPAVRGEKGQFFTPRSAAKAVVDILDPKPRELILDPACGSGTFLSLTYEHFLKNHKKSNKKISFSKNLYGIDKEADLVKICKTYMVLLGDGHTGISCFDSLDRRTWLDNMIKLTDEGFNVIMTNPPFGTKIAITSKEILKDYSLAHKWEYSKKENRWKLADKLLPKQAPQVLFMELCVQLLKPGGRLGIVLPEGIVGNKQSGFILDYLRSQGQIFAIIDAPRTLFQPSTDIKTVILFFRKKRKSSDNTNKDILMAEVQFCGHDKRGRNIFDQDGNILDEFQNINFNKIEVPSRLGFIVKEGEYDPYCLIPRYYNPEVKNKLKKLKKENKIDTYVLGELESKKVIKIFRGYDPVLKSYDSGDIPYIRTSDIFNFEINYDTTLAVEKEDFNKISKKIKYKPHDILIVNDGRYRIGNNCMLTEHDVDVVIQSHIRIIRVLRPEVINPFLLLYLLNTNLVQDQIKHKVFIQSTIATLGNRLKEIQIPIPKDKKLKNDIIQKMESVILERAKLLHDAVNILNNSWDEVSLEA